MLVTIITSAAIGAFVSAIVGVIGSMLERRARRKELLLVKAIDLAIDRTRIGLEIAEKTQTPALFLDNIYLAETYYRELTLLLDKGKLSEAMIAKKSAPPYQPLKSQLPIDILPA